jgi:hypothetical protein
MSSPYPSTQAQIHSGNTVFYPHSMSVVASQTGSNFQSYQASGENRPGMEIKTTTVKMPTPDVTGTPLRQQGVALGDMSNASPFRQVVMDTSGLSGYKQVITENTTSGVTMLKPTTIDYSPSSNTGATYTVSGGVVSGSFQPQPVITSFDYGNAGFSGVYQSGTTSYTSFPQFSQNSYSFGSSMATPFMTGGYTAGLTPRSYMSGMTSGQMGLTPRSYQEQVNAMMMMPGISSMQSDPSMMMFAENFRNQCIAMSQYYATHPEARVESPQPMSPPLPTILGNGSNNAASKRILISAFPSTKRENSHNEKHIDTHMNTAAPIAQNDDVLDLLDQLAAEDPVSAVPLSNQDFTESPPREQSSEPVERKPSMMSAFWRSITNCGRNNTHP